MREQWGFEEEMKEALWNSKVFQCDDDDDRKRDNDQNNNPLWNWKQFKIITRQSKQCGFSIYIFDNSKSKSMVRLVRAEKMVLSGLVFARKIARMILIQNI